MKLIAPLSLSLAAGIGLGYFVLPKGSDSNAGEQDGEKRSGSTKYESITSSTGTSRTTRRGGLSGDFLKTSANLGSTKSAYADYSDEQFRAASLEMSELAYHDRLERQVLLFKAWAERDPEGALAFIEEGELKQNQGSKFFSKSMIYSIWGNADPAAAAAALTESGDVRNRAYGSNNSYSGHVVQAWVKQDPEAALAWVQELSTKQREDILSGYMKALYSEDPELAQQQLNSFTGEAQEEGVEGIAEIWGKENDWVTTQQNIASLPEDLQKDALRSALRSFTAENPTEAKDIISNTELDSRSKDRLVYSLANNIASEDPQEAMEWVSSNASERMSAYASRVVFDKWTKQNGGEAAEWLLAQPKGTNTNLMITQALRNGSLPESTEELLRSHVDPDASSPRAQRR